MKDILFYAHFFFQVEGIYFLEMAENPEAGATKIKDM